MDDKCSERGFTWTKVPAAATPWTNQIQWEAESNFNQISSRQNISLFWIFTRTPSYRSIFKTSKWVDWNSTRRSPKTGHWIYIFIHRSPWQPFWEDLKRLWRLCAGSVDSERFEKHWRWTNCANHHLAAASEATCLCRPGPCQTSSDAHSNAS